MKYLKLSAIISTCALLCGCFSDLLAPREDPTQFYILDSVPEQTAYKCPVDAVSLSAVAVPAYFNKPQIVSAGGGAEVELSEFHRWAESPESLLARNFAKCLGANLSGSQVFVYPDLPPYTLEKVCVLRIYISECLGKIGGEFKFSGRCVAALRGGKNSVIVPFSKTVSAGEGYNGYVAAIAKCVAEVSADIAKSISNIK